MKFAVVFFALFVAAASAAPEARRPLRNFQRQQVQQHQSQGQRQYHGQGQQKFHGQNQRQFQRRYQQQHQVQPEVLHHQEQPQPQQLHQQQQQVVPVNNLRSLNDPSQARILKYENDNIGVGPYNYAFETDDGQKREEHGELRHVGTEQEGIAVHGSYSYVLDGVTYTVNYVADENGFRPEGAHLPH